MQKLSARFSEISRNWFLTQPLYFSILTSHALVENTSLSIPMRSGQLRIEYNPSLLEKCSDSQLQACLKVEATRILLGHPYERQPYNCKKKVLLLASDMVISQVMDQQTLENLPYELAGLSFVKCNPQLGRIDLLEKLPFEGWYRRLLHIIEKNSIAGSESAGQGGELSGLFEAEEAGELWEENQEALENIKNQIQKADIDEGWGESGGNLALELRESGDFSFDYKRALTRFRAKIVSAQRHLTRMRPSRRYGFSAMGSRYERKANILIAVDVSGSITEESFSNFYHAISNFFFLGIIEKIDLIFFDVNLKNSKPITFRGSRSKINLEEIKGRGGTSFEAPYEYYIQHSNEYSGMIIFTDGEGNSPYRVLNTAKASLGTVLWILDSRLSFEKSRYWIEKLPGASVTYLPF